MKKAMSLALMVLAAVAAHADNTAQKNQVVTASAHKAVESAAAVQLSADEQAFAAKLNDQNRHHFCEKLSQEKRLAAMVAAKNGADANEAVAHLMTAQDVKAGSVADAAQAEAGAVK